MVMDFTHLLDNEQGSALDAHSAMFSDFDDGGVFNPDQFREQDLKKMFREYGKSATIEQVLTLPIRRAALSIRQGEATARTTDFIEKALFSTANNGGMSTPMNLIIAQMTGAITYRKSYFEKVFTEREGKVVYDKLAWRPAATCTIRRNKKNGAFEGFKQQPYRWEGNADPILFKPDRAFVYIHGTHRNPLEGVSDFEVAYWCYKTSQKIRFLWYSFLEGQSLPKTVVKARTQEEADRGARKVRGLRSGGVIGITDQITLDTHESSGKGAEQFKEALQWLDSEASSSVLAGFTDLGGAAANGTGSFALSKDQTDFFLMSRQAVAREMQDHINQYMIPDLVRHNFGPNAATPTVEFAPIAEDDMAQAVSLLQATSQSESPNIPREFMDELVERVAGFLELNTTKVREGLDRAAKEAKERAESLGVGDPNGVAPVAGAVGAAAKLVNNMQNPPPPPENTPGQSMDPNANAHVTGGSAYRPVTSPDSRPKPVR